MWKRACRIAVSCDARAAGRWQVQLLFASLCEALNGGLPGRPFRHWQGCAWRGKRCGREFAPGALALAAAASFLFCTSKVQSLPLCFTDLPNLFGAKELESLELQAICAILHAWQCLVGPDGPGLSRCDMVQRCATGAALDKLRGVPAQEFSNWDCWELRLRDAGFALACAEPAWPGF